MYDAFTMAALNRMRQSRQLHVICASAAGHEMTTVLCRLTSLARPIELTIRLIGLLSLANAALAANSACSKSRASCGQFRAVDTYYRRRLM